MQNDSPETTDAARGAVTLMDVLDAASNDGYDTQFVATEDGSVRCTACDETVPAGDLDVSRTDRLEGASDAADMMLVARAACPRCGCGGTIVLGYGPNASDADVAVLSALDLPDPVED